MARKDIRGRDYTIYLPTKEDLLRWKALAKPTGSNLSHWIFEMVELAIENRPSTPKVDTDELNKLRAENQQLKAELERLRTWQASIFKISETKDTFHPMPFGKAVINLLKRGGKWSSIRITKELKLYFKAGYDSRDLGKVIDQLEELGLIKETENGWIWNK